jgi:hypothetical protein
MNILYFTITKAKAKKYNGILRTFNKTCLLEMTYMDAPKNAKINHSDVANITDLRMCFALNCIKNLLKIFFVYTKIKNNYLYFQWICPIFETSQRTQKDIFIVLDLQF